MNNAEECMEYYNQIKKKGITIIHSMLTFSIFAFVVYSIYDFAFLDRTLRSALHKALVVALLVCLKYTACIYAYIFKAKTQLWNDYTFLFSITGVHFLLNQSILFVCLTSHKSDLFKGMLMGLYILMASLGSSIVFMSFNFSIMLQLINFIIIVVASIVYPYLREIIPFCIVIPHFLLVAIKFLDQNSKRLFMKQKEIKKNNQKISLFVNNSISAIALLCSESNNLTVQYFNNQWNDEPFSVYNSTELMSLLINLQFGEDGTLKQIIDKKISEQYLNTIKCSYDMEMDINNETLYFKFDITIIKDKESYLIFLQCINNTSCITLEKNKLKSKMMCSITHELLTPLNTIMCITQKIKSELPNNDSMILEINSNLLHLKIEDFICLAECALPNGSIVSNKSFSNVSDLINLVTSLYKHDAGSKSISIIVMIENSVPKAIYFDKLRFMQILNNLLSNSVKYNYYQGKVLIRIKYDYDQMQVTVEDTGQGFDMAMLHRSQFAGIGLTIVKYICKQLNYNLQCHSIISKGTKFTFQIDCKQEHLIPIDLKATSDYFCYVIADDCFFNRLTIKLMLNKILKSYKCVEATNGKEAVRIIDEVWSKYSKVIVFMDVDMPVMNGIEATNLIKSKGTRKSVSIYGVTAFSKQDVLDKCIEVGMIKAFTKPISINQLKECVY